MANAATALLHARITSGLGASTATSERPRSDHHRLQAVLDPAAAHPRASWGLESPTLRMSSLLRVAGGVLGGTAKTSPPGAMLGDRQRPAALPAHAVESAAPAKAVPAGLAQLTWLENNGWIWEVAGVRLLVDPWLLAELDFNIPLFYSAKKRATKDLTVAGLPPLDAVLITQSLEDHCHMKTLREVARARPTLLVIAPPSAQSKLEPLFKNLVVLAHDQTTSVSGADGSSITVRATPGDRVGPPWQARENGYVVSTKGPDFSLYYEPHCKFDDISKDEQVDCVITPSVSQNILGYSLVAGEERAVELARQLKATYIVPMLNGDLEATGLLSAIVKTGSGPEAFQKIASPEFTVLTPQPGQPLAVPPTQ
ncbi:hypothetical protein KFL_004610060 [Klebsormidium nitens]|uniref:Metallo-beta-lactamase domain-containing protein n=1 Tax=Klebsormidium nitens TaxID=105231 RepID=A0A1Y1IIA9_KLENI|nr:hypothetical protein KFL_004610060 [Klebsormidium nitens]|eukprot:GAQ88811.1 hypothetical protein KFL_004610060 [Klebsormidium nitens]